MYAYNNSVLLLICCAVMATNGRLNFITITNNGFMTADYVTVMKVALEDMEKRYPIAMANYSWIPITNSTKTFTLCSSADTDATYQSMLNLYKGNKLQVDGALTVLFDPSKIIFLVKRL